MRVTVNENFSFTYEMVPYTVPAGGVIEGQAAIHLLMAKAPVTPADDDAQRVADGEVDEPPVGEQEAIEPDVSELDIAGTIDQVLAWVGDSPERALQAHQAEEERGDKARSTLLAKLAEIGLSS